MDFRGFVQTFILVPAQVLLRGRQLVLRLLAWRPPGVRVVVASP
jgi:hypothetical protein